MCAIIADSLMSTSNEMCGGFLVRTVKHCYANAIRYRGVARVESKGRQKSRMMGSSGSRVKPALEESTLGGSGGMPPQKPFGFQTF